MNLIIVLFLILIAASMFTGASATRASRRRHRRARRVQRNADYAISQERNLLQILGTNELSLFNVDQIGSGGHYNQAICGYMNEYMFINGSLVEYTDAVQSAFTNEYFATIYQRKNFPLTHRPVGEVWLNATNESVQRFHKLHCPVPMNYDGLAMAFLVFGTIFAFTITMVSCFASLCLSFDKYMEERRINRARRAKNR
jgi:hypothetical protein